MFARETCTYTIIVPIIVIILSVRNNNNNSNNNINITNCKSNNQIESIPQRIAQSSCVYLLYLEVIITLTNV